MVDVYHKGKSAQELQTHVQAALCSRHQPLLGVGNGLLQSGAGYGITNKNEIWLYLHNTSVIL